LNRSDRWWGWGVRRGGREGERGGDNITVQACCHWTRKSMRPTLENEGNENHLTDQFIQRKGEVAVFIQDEEPSLPFLPTRYKDRI